MNTLLLSRSDVRNLLDMATVISSVEQAFKELEPAILNSAIVVVDDIEQTIAGGEINIPIKLGLFKAEDIRATLGDIIIGKKKGRGSRDMSRFSIPPGSPLKM
jgi:ornithine cyclodeaminase/alanine dehydrogenase-like protein (mu-crystallin family)